MSVCNVQFRVIGGHELPKTDLFSQIDPYVIVSFNDERLGRTASRDNDPNPVWNEDFYFEAEEDDQALYGSVLLELYDEEVTVDAYVACARLDLSCLDPEAWTEPLDLGLEWRGDKKGAKWAKTARNARLTVQVVAVGKAFSSWAEELAELEAEGGARVDPRGRAFLLPVPDTGERLWAGMRFGARATHLLLADTAPGGGGGEEDDGYGGGGGPAGGVAYELAYSGAPSLRLERLTYRRPVKLMGLKVWSECRATNVPLDANLNKVRILERERRLVDTLEPAEVLAAQGFMIGMPFLTAVKEMGKRSGVHVDSAAQALWIRMDPGQPQPSQLLQLDYAAPAPAALEAEAPLRPSASGLPPDGPGKKGSRRGDAGGSSFSAVGSGGGPALRVWSTTSELNRGYELGWFGGGGGGRGGAAPLVSVAEAWKRPQRVVGGAYQVVHTLELRGAFEGETLNEVGLGCYEQARPLRTWRLGRVLRGPPPEEEELPEEPPPARGGGGWGGAGGGLAKLFECLPCLGPGPGPREEAYVVAEGWGREEGGGGERGYRAQGAGSGNSRGARGGGRGAVGEAKGARRSGDYGGGGGSYGRKDGGYGSGYGSGYGARSGNGRGGPSSIASSSAGPGAGGQLGRYGTPRARRGAGGRGGGGGAGGGPGQEPVDPGAGLRRGLQQSGGWK
ncbi:hypothetical protein HYH03_012298 [Edaphochlamys debaryana]|uniref:C2 domain-containing protein n=1 Tax=Edaphochlamys debaryana TaxID=47281 RepID=A0A835XUK1_9CHLO|nr:hypothetical protein HYH03_012298 [Edaphochlamys debaryana]|eukprot:KAG2489278.1 hypothetical protein HYH03_012298 [Edaphochlamys debaryana]